MRTIKKRPPPNALVTWRTPRLAENRGPGIECTYEEMRRDPPVLQAVEDGLYAEQGGLCAYTGMQIELHVGSPREVGFHLEHVKAQKYCCYGEDADYGNIVACWPRPNQGFEPVYGAVRKMSWPAPEELGLFVSPLVPSCTSRFSFNHRGEIAATDSNDAAAKTTIEKLGLDNGELTELRLAAIRGTLKPGKKWLTLEQVRRLLQKLETEAASLDRGEHVRLRAFSFVLQQVLAREIRKLEGIKEAKRQAGSSKRR